MRGERFIYFFICYLYFILYRQKLGIPIDAKVEADKADGTTLRYIENQTKKLEQADKLEGLNDEVITLKLEVYARYVYNVIDYILLL